VWHTQGSGKSLTMVMLAKSLALHPGIPSPKFVLGTDRIDLDDQIWGTFRPAGLEPEQARTGKHLVKLLKDRPHACGHHFDPQVRHRCIQPDLSEADRNHLRARG